MFSYDGSMHVGINTDPAAIPDPDVLFDGFWNANQERTSSNFAANAAIGTASSGTTARWEAADLDGDGDLDAVQMTTTGPRWYANSNGDASVWGSESATMPAPTL